ncbi:hypothetical protein GOBAR_AA40016 [Gossypium barbadense]|uniref:Uncharacterized protein n=1 Tax=Gossypium barbadense TaxID=3634 RepID=A0A2P5VPH0_GOSBA|nr:hypothetical protein GOBAR_AA40016 [Gossypium barbadense]
MQQCKTKTTLENPNSKLLLMSSPPKNIDLISCGSMIHVSDIKLIRTDTTLDLSQKAEKGDIILNRKICSCFDGYDRSDNRRLSSSGYAINLPLSPKLMKLVQHAANSTACRPRRPSHVGTADAAKQQMFRPTPRPISRAQAKGEAKGCRSKLLA